MKNGGRIKGRIDITLCFVRGTVCYCKVRPLYLLSSRME